MNDELFPGVRRLADIFSLLGTITIVLGVAALLVALLSPASNDADATALVVVVGAIVIGTLLIACGFYFAGALLDMLMAIELNGRDE